MIHAIFAADIHIRPDTPKCRIDDYQESQWDKWYQILELAKEHFAPVIIAGDLGHRPEWPGWLLRQFIQSLMHPELEIFMVPGQHDLPNHSLEKWHRAALGVLDAADCIYFMDGKDEPLWADKMVLNAIPWARPFPRKPVIADGPHERTLAVCHRLVMEGKGNKADFPGASFDFAINLLKKHTEYDVILTGDNHKPFVVEHEGRLLVNPGSMMRMTADQINHRPRVYLYDREKNTVEPHYLKTKRGVISRDHIEEMKEKESRMEAFVTSVKENVEIGLSFEDTLERYISENKITDNIISKLWECIHNE